MKWVIRIVGGLLLLLVLAGVGLYVASHRANAGKMHTSAELNGSPELIWPWLNDGDKLKQWVSWLVEVRGWKNGGGPGDTRVLVMKDENNGGMLMEIASVCTDFAPPSRLGVKLSVSGEFDGDQVYRLTDLGNGKTRVEMDSRYRFASPFAQLMEPLITAAAGKKATGDLAHLKELVAAQPTAAVR
ncbi:MAG TPA: SRPBCC family protein [Bryobacteraceae bacterium]|nr:SRPBCC family protein [Bryobacteraceae bacterium]